MRYYVYKTVIKMQPDRDVLIIFDYIRGVFETANKEPSAIF